MKYLLSGAALLVLVAAGPAWANNVFDCQDVGMSAPEPIGDQEGHALLTGTFSCRLTAGPHGGWPPDGHARLGDEQGRGHPDLGHGRDPQAGIAGRLQGYGGHAQAHDGRQGGR